MNARAAELVERLHLRPHPEGGFYAEVHRSAQDVDALDGRPRRAALTSIYFLLPAGVVSRWHRVLSDEVWCHLEGAPIELHLLDAAQPSARTVALGPVSATRPRSTPCPQASGRPRAAAASTAWPPAWWRPDSTSPISH